MKARSSDGVPPRLSPKEYLIPKVRLQARLPGTWSARALPAFACPSPGMHLPSRSSCREADTQAAREQTANPPAGTALAPMTRCASAPCPSMSEDANVTGMETDVKDRLRKRYVEFDLSPISAFSPQSGDWTALLARPLWADCVAKLKNEGAGKFRNLPVEMDFRRYD